MPKPSVLITGATSLVINDLIDHMLNAGFEVTGVTSKRRPGQRTDIHWMEWDLTQPLTGEVDQNYTLIIHAAALSNSYTITRYHQVNVVATQHICQLAQQLRKARFIYISSVLACKGCGRYGESKLHAEQIIIKSLKNWTVVRPAQIYGQSSQTPVDQLIARLKNSTVSVMPADTLSNLFPMHYSEFSREMMKLIVSGSVQATYYITGPRQFSFDGLVEEIAHHIKKKHLYIKVPKAVMLAYSNISSGLRLKFGPYPDQIHRLYYANPEPFKGNCIKTQQTIGEYCVREVPFQGDQI